MLIAKRRKERREMDIMALIDGRGEVHFWNECVVGMMASCSLLLKSAGVALVSLNVSYPQPELPMVASSASSHPRVHDGRHELVVLEPPRKMVVQACSGCRKRKKKYDDHRPCTN